MKRIRKRKLVQKVIELLGRTKNGMGKTERGRVSREPHSHTQKHGSRKLKEGKQVISRVLLNRKTMK